MITHVSKLLIGDGANTAFTGIPNIAAGDIGIFTKANTLAAATDVVTTSENHEVIRIAQGVGTGVAKFSFDISLWNIKSAKAEAYVAPVAKVLDLVPASNFVPSTGSITATYTVNIVLLDDIRTLEQRQTRLMVSVTVAEGTTATNIVTALANAINADRYASSYITAANNSGNLRLTAKTVPVNSIDKYQYIDFTAAITKIDPINKTSLAISKDTLVSTDPATVVAAANPGHGTSQQIKDLESSIWGWEGFTNRTAFPIPTPTSYVVGGATYDVITIEHYLVKEGDFQFYQRNPVATILAIPTGSAQLTAVKTTLNSLLNSVGIASV